MEALDDGLVVVHLARVDLGVGLEVLKVAAGLDAFQALAVQTASGLGPGLLGRIARRVGHGRFGQGLHCLDIGEQPGLEGAFPVATGGERNPLEKTVQGYGGPAALGHEIDPRRGLGAVGPAGEHALGHGQGLGVGRGGRGKIQGVIVQGQAGRVEVLGWPRGRVPVHGGAQAEDHAHGLHAGDFGVQGLGRQLVGRQCQQQAADALGRGGHGHAPAFLGQVPGRGQARRTGPHDQGRARLGRHGQAAGAGLGALDHGPFQVADADGIAPFAAQAGGPAGLIADAGQNRGQGQVPLEHGPGLVHVSGGHEAAQGAGVQVQGAGRLAARRFLLDAAGFQFPEACLVHVGS